MYRCAIIIDEYFDLGLQFRNFGNYEEAIRNYDKSININPTFPRSWLEKGEALASLGRLKDANDCFNKATNLGYVDMHNSDIGYTPALFWADKGCSLQWLDKYQEAVECFDKSIKMDKNCIEAHIGKGKSLCYLFRYEEALDCYYLILEFINKDENSINRNALLEDVWTNIGIALSYLEKYDEAIDCFNKVLEWDGQYLDALKGKGRALYNKEDYREAISCLNNAIDISPKESNLWYDLGCIYRKILKNEEAINCFDQVIMLSCDCETDYKTSCLIEKAWRGKGYIFIRKGEYEKSIKCFNNVIRYSPDNARILNFLSITCRYLGDYEKSIEYCNRIIDNLKKLNQIDIGFDIFSNYEKAKRDSNFTRPEIYDKDINFFREHIKKNGANKINNLDGFYEALKNKAYALLVLGNNKEAVSYLEEAKNVNSNAEILNAMGVAYKNLCNYEKAIGLFNEALASNPKYLKALANKAETLDCLGNFSDAINCLSEVLNFEDLQGIKDEKENQLSEAWSNKGLSLIHLRSYSEANIAFDKAIKFMKFNEIAWYGKGKALTRMGYKDDAIYCFKKANDYFDKTKETRSSEYLIHKGSTLLNLHKYKESIICYNKAAELGNNSSELWYDKGSALLTLHKYDAAIECYEKVIGMNNQQLKDVYINLCYAFIGLGNYERAALYFNQQIIEVPESISALNAKGILLIEQRKYEEAVKCYDILTNIKTRDHKIWNNRGVALKKLKKFDEAIKCFETALELNEDYATALNNKGNIYSEMGNFEEAINCYDKAIQIEYDYFEAIFNKAKIFIKLENQTEALIYLDKAILLATHSSCMACREDLLKDLLLAKAFISERLGLSKDSIDCLNKIIVFDPDDWNLKYFLGNLLYKEKEYDEAINCYDDVISKLNSCPSIININYYVFDISMKLGEIFTNMNLYDCAEECLRNAQRISPPEIRFNPELVAIELKIQKGKKLRKVNNVGSFKKYDIQLIDHEYSKNIPRESSNSDQESEYNNGVEHVARADLFPIQEKNLENVEEQVVRVDQTSIQEKKSYAERIIARYLASIKENNSKDEKNIAEIDLNSIKITESSNPEEDLARINLNSNLESISSTIDENFGGENLNVIQEKESNKAEDIFGMDPTYNSKRKSNNGERIIKGMEICIKAPFQLNDIIEFIERLEDEGKPVGPFVLMDNLNLAYFDSEELLRKIGYQFTNNVDNESGMHIWKKRHD